ncbi:unnamed protein product [Discosporangium mesarthrocarpum]
MAVIRNMAGINSDIKAMFGEVGGCEAVVGSMRTCAKIGEAGREATLQACCAAKTLAAGNTPNKIFLIQAGVWEALTSVFRLHESNEAVVEAACVTAYELSGDEENEIRGTTEGKEGVRVLVAKAAGRFEANARLVAGAKATLHQLNRISPAKLPTVPPGLSVASEGNIKDIGG